MERHILDHHTNKNRCILCRRVISVRAIIVKICTVLGHLLPAQDKHLSDLTKNKELDVKEKPSDRAEEAESTIKPQEKKKSGKTIQVIILRSYHSPYVALRQFETFYHTNLCRALRVYHILNE